ncbi:MAG TPA: hypothetical protein VNH11_35370, partial [Pirellulales bacterium]|nr:hypothetical protein [Pirellulales bacterium]
RSSETAGQIIATDLPRENTCSDRRFAKAGRPNPQFQAIFWVSGNCCSQAELKTAAHGWYSGDSQADL